MVDTGGTLIKAAHTLLDNGAKKVVACCVHGVLSSNAIERISDSKISELIITDTILVPKHRLSKNITVLSVAPLFGEAIRRIHSDDSISSLFK